MFGSWVLRLVHFHRPFLQHPRILAFNTEFSTHQDLAQEIVSILNSEAQQNNFNVIREGIGFLGLIVKTLDFQNKSKFAPVFVKYGEWFSAIKKNEGALLCFTTALEIYDESPENFEEERLKVTVSQVNELLRLKNFKQCERLLEGLKKSCERVPSAGVRAEYFEACGRVKVLLNKQEEAIVCFERAKDEFGKVGDEEGLFHLISVENHLGLLYCLKGEKRFETSLILATELLERFEESDTEKLAKCLEMWSYNVNFVEDREKFEMLVGRIGKVVLRYSADVRLKYFEDILKFSEEIGKTVEFNKKLYEEYLRFVEENFRRDWKLLDRVYFMNACRRLMDGEYDETIECAKKSLEIRKLYRDVDDLLVVYSVLIDAYIGKREAFSARLLIKEVNIIFKSHSNPDLLLQHKKNLEKLNNLFISH